MGSLNGAVAAPEFGAVHRSRWGQRIRHAADKIHLRLWIRYPVFLLFMEGLSQVLEHWSGRLPLHDHLRLEVPLLLAFYWAFGFVLRRGKLSALVAALPLMMTYIACDVYFIAYGDVLRVIDVGNLPELLKVLHFEGTAALLFALALPAALLLAFVDYRRYWRALTVAGLLIAGAAAVEFFPHAVVSGLVRAGVEQMDFSDAGCLDDNGRITVLIYFEAARRVAVAQTVAYRARAEKDERIPATAEFIRAHGNRRNVYLVVLESWLDPTLFRGVTFSQDPRHPDYAQLVGDSQGFSISPVFGGRTAQAEFEALCGVPALSKITFIEFNTFTGHPAGCMPAILRQAGYSTYASNAYMPDYFNTIKAYTGIGFDKIYFAREFAPSRETYLSAADISEDEDFLFDGDLFNQNLAFIARTLKEHPGQPILNYVLTIYGHEPHDIDTDRRPMVLSMNAPHDDLQLLRAANQYWYRTQAIAAYVRGLIKLDPNSLIILVSDHVPPLDRGTSSYKDFRYLDNIDDSIHMNRILVVENGKVVRHQTIHHYQVPSLIYNYLTEEKFCAQHNCDPSADERKDQYMLLMSRAASPM
jgi:phosphoglycerol transferase MdoB-like AlkP superfamily enzyme